MNRREFMVSIPVLCACAGSAMASKALPQIENQSEVVFQWIPPKPPDKSDCLMQVGYATAKYTIGGETYGVVHYYKPDYSGFSNYDLVEIDVDVARSRVTVDLLSRLAEERMTGIIDKKIKRSGDQRLTPISRCFVERNGAWHEQEPS